MSELIKESLRSSNENNSEISELLDYDAEDAGSLLAPEYVV